LAQAAAGAGGRQARQLLAGTLLRR
jgi:hypothetical protein